MRGELFQHLSLGQVLSRTISMFVDRFNVYMALTTAMMIPLMVVACLTKFMIGMEGASRNVEEGVSKTLEKVVEVVSKNQGVDENGQDVDDILAHIQDIQNNILANLFLYASTIPKSFVFWNLVKLLLDQIIFASGEAGIIRAAAEMYATEDGLPPYYSGWWTCWMQFGVHQLGRLLLGRVLTEMTVAFGFAVAFGFRVSGLWSGAAMLLMLVGLDPFVIFLVVFVLVLGTWLGFFLWWYPSVLLTVPVMVVERKGPNDAIQRSFEITQGRRYYVVCAFLFLYILKEICAQLLQIISGVVIGTVLEWLYHPLSTILAFCLYVSIRADTEEGLTRSILQQELWDHSCADYRQVVALTERDNTSSMNQKKNL